MSAISNAHLLIAAQLYGGTAPARPMREAAGASDFATELTPRAKDKKPLNPTVGAPATPKPMAPAKPLDEGASRREAMASPREAVGRPKEDARPARPGSQLDIRV